MRAFRNILILLIIAIVFVFVFAGDSPLDDFLPLTETKGAVITAVIGGVYDLGKGDYLVKTKSKDGFTEKMQQDGWQLLSQDGDSYVFGKDGQEISYRESSFFSMFTIYRLEQ